MKILLIFSLFMSGFFISCNSDKNRLLEGSWKLQSVHPNKYCDTKECLLSFSMLNLISRNSGYKFQRDKLYINNKKVADYRISKNQILTDTNEGNNLIYKFRINGKKLTLWNNDVTLELTKS
jgi:hypothetical protein